MTRMPVIFLGHGSPMNAIESNSFTLALKSLSRKIPPPKSILCISAHWVTEGPWLTHMQSPKTIHDFYGFPKELFDIQYPAPGNPRLAEELKTKFPEENLQLDDSNWGLDHGTWSVLRHLYPEASIPVLQLSLNQNFSSSQHFELGQKLSYLRDEQVLIIGSGNIVHNLQKIQWNPNDKAHDWAEEFDKQIKNLLVARDLQAILQDSMKTPAAKLSIPTSEHFDPLYYIMGASHTEDTLHFDFEGIQHASISMLCVRFGS